MDHPWGSCKESPNGCAKPGRRQWGDDVDDVDVGARWHGCHGCHGCHVSCIVTLLRGNTVFFYRFSMLTSMTTCIRLDLLMTFCILGCMKIHVIHCVIHCVIHMKKVHLASRNRQRKVPGDCNTVRPLGIKPWRHGTGLQGFFVRQYVQEIRTM